MKTLKVITCLLLISSVSKAQVMVTAIVKHLERGHPNATGSILLAASGGDSPYHFNWLLDNSQDQNRDHLPFGYYFVNVTDHIGNGTARGYNVAYKCDWTDTYGTLYRNDSLFTDGLTVQGNDYALSANFLRPETPGWFEVVLDEFNGPFLMGFQDSLSFSMEGDIRDIDFGILISQDNAMYSWYDHQFSYLGRATKGIPLRIERDETHYSVFYNGSMLFTMPAETSRSIRMRAFVSDNAIANAGCSFIDSTTTRALGIKSEFNHVNVDGIEQTGDLGLQGYGGSSPYTFTWLSENTHEHAREDLSRGSYRVQVEDASGTNVVYEYLLGYNVKWRKYNKSYHRHDSLIIWQNNPPSLQSTAESANLLKGNTDGWVQLVTGQISGDAIIGFRYSDVEDLPGSYADVRFGFFIDASAKLHSLENGNPTEVGFVVPGDVVHISRTGEIFTLKLNAQELLVSAAEQGSELRIKTATDHSFPTSNLGCSFTPPLDATVKKRGADADHPYNGIAEVYPFGENGPYTVQWPDTLIGQYHTELCPTRVRVFLSDPALTDTGSKYFDIGIKAPWSNRRNVVFDQDSTWRPEKDSMGVAAGRNSFNGGESGYFEIPLMKKYGDFSVGFAGYKAPESMTQENLEVMQLARMNTAYSLITKAINNSLSYHEGRLAEGEEYDSVHVVRVHGGTLRVLFNGAAENAVYPVDDNDVIKAGRTAAGHLFVQRNDETIYEDGRETAGQALGPVVVVNSNPKIEVGIGTISLDGLPPGLQPPLVYAIPQVKLDGGYHTSYAGKVYFAVEGEYNTQATKYKVFNGKNQVVLSLSNTGLIAPNQIIGDNRYALNVSSLPNGFYVLEVTNEKNEKLYLRFKHYVSSGGGTGIFNPQ